MAEETKTSQDTPDAEEALDAADITASKETTVETQDAQLPEGQPGPAAPGGQIDILLNTSMPVEVRLGDVDMEVRDLLQIGPGTIITLDKKVGEPLDLYLKGILFAKGQLVVSGDTLGVRITRILPRRKADQHPGKTNK